MSLDPSLSLYTYMKTGGPADEVIQANTEDELIDLIIKSRKNKRRFYVLGSGSNTLFTDAGFRGLVILNRTKNLTIDDKLAKINVSSGCPINYLVNQAASNSLSGLEWYLGLPGTVGGAIYNNSHFKDHLFGEIVDLVTVLKEDNQLQKLTHNQLDFAYDHSRFHQTKEIIINATLSLKIGDKAAIAQDSADSLKFRATRQPLALPSSGCIFKNPETKFAGALIDQAGLKGVSIGGASVSQKHANFIVNTGQATAADIQALADQIESEVLAKLGVQLEREVFFINEFGERINHERL